MPVAERLRALNGPDPDIDVDRAFEEVGRRAHAHRRRRRAAHSVVVVVVVVSAVLVMGNVVDRDHARIDTGDGRSMQERHLPGWVPEGFRLGWVDTPVEAARSLAGDDPLWERPHDYAYGYRTETAELEVRVLSGGSIDDAQSVADGFGDGGVAETLDGRPAVRWSRDGYTRLLLEIDGGVVHVATHPLGRSYPDGRNPAMPSQQVVERFAISIARVDESTWNAVLSSSDADVASTFGPKDGERIVEGDGWALVHGEFRAPLSVRHDAMWVDFADGASSAVGFSGLAESMLHAEIAVSGSTRVAWGVLPGSAERVNLTIDGESFGAATMQIRGRAAFAIDISGTRADSGEIEIVDSDGRRTDWDITSDR